ncbi:MAG: glycosyltransferase family 2 protein, partial [Paludibacteraceae bacterium]|nr:glycosyltransferase family 2 protein [Paludibacteraceae bacterium]
MPTISVIVPVYNTASYLSRCIESLVNQTYSDLQIILIDDGSTDESGAIADEWQTKDPRI